MPLGTYRHANEIINTDGNWLWIGDVQAAENIAWLQEHNIKTGIFVWYEVFTVATGFKINYSANIKHIKYELADHKSSNISNYFDIAAYQIHKYIKSGSILVHCGAGVSRSATIVIAYLIRYHHMTFKEALGYCKEKRPEICPNLGFEYQLKAYEHKRCSSKKQSVDLSYESRTKGSRDLPRIYHSQLQKQFQYRRHISSNPSNNLIYHPQLPAKRSVAEKGRELGWLKRIAEFRFGITNTKGWGLKGQMLKLSDKL